MIIHTFFFYYSDAQYETEATLDHYFYHDNTPPFLALRLIQRLVTSNPSPRYVEDVANAFKTGSFEVGNVSFGTKKYGDMEAFFAAIYLHSAARDVIVDSDISSGAVREPLIKVLALMRSMEFVSKFPVIAMVRLLEDIGQMAHQFQTVFSFFLPEFKPSGLIGDMSLVSPESTLIDLPKIIGLLNGLTSLVKFGLSSCRGGWSYERCVERMYSPAAVGYLEFNRTHSEQEFSFESFEGPSLAGGLDNTWIGRYFDPHNGLAIPDPSESNSQNHVLTFRSAQWHNAFMSPPIENKDSNGQPYVVKFRFLSTAPISGGCIGFVEVPRTYLNTQTWVLCDPYQMQSNGNWISCQFAVPPEVGSFRIAVGDTRYPEGDAFFDDIQIASGNETTCSNVNIPKRDPPGKLGYSRAVVDRLSTLLTAGRLGDASKDVIAKAYDNAGSAIDGLKIAQQLIVTTAEFHTTNAVKTTNQPRENIAYPEPTGKPYRAVIFLMLNGGCDSYNMVAPYNCDNGLYQEYLGKCLNNSSRSHEYPWLLKLFFCVKIDVRQQVALSKDILLPISATGQVCSEFGIHPQLPSIKKFYDDEDLLFFANTGVLSRPVTKDNFYTLTNVQLFAHNAMQLQAQKIDPYDIYGGTGVLGRMGDILTKTGHNVGSFSIDRFSIALVGEPGVSETPMTVSSRGLSELHLDDIIDILPDLHNASEPDSGIFAETWSSNLLNAIETNDLLGEGLANATTSVDFPNTYLGQTLSTVSRVIATRELRGADVDTFFIQQGGKEYIHNCHCYSSINKYLLNHTTLFCP